MLPPLRRFNLLSGRCLLCFTCCNFGSTILGLRVGWATFQLVCLNPPDPHCHICVRAFSSGRYTTLESSSKPGLGVFDLQVGQSWIIETAADRDGEKLSSTLGEPSVSIQTAHARTTSRNYVSLYACVNRTHRRVAAPGKKPQIATRMPFLEACGGLFLRVHLFWGWFKGTPQETTHKTIGFWGPLKFAVLVAYETNTQWDCLGRIF